MATAVPWLIYSGIIADRNVRPQLLTSPPRMTKAQHAETSKIAFYHWKTMIDSVDKKSYNQSIYSFHPYKNIKIVRLRANYSSLWACTFIPSDVILLMGARKPLEPEQA